MSGPIKVQKGISLQRSQLIQDGQIPKAYDKKIRDVSKLYETQFLREMFKAMKGTVEKSGFIKEGMAEKIFQEKLEHQYIDKWGDKGGVGLGNIIYQQLKDRILNAQRGYIPMPKGPLPLKKGTMIKVDETLNLPDFKKTEPGQSKGSGKEMSFILERPQEAEMGGAKVQSPWAGEIKQIIKSDDGRKTVRIDHEGMVESVLSFKGAAPEISTGQKVEAGEVLGTILEAQQAMTWKVRELGSA